AAEKDIDRLKQEAAKLTLLVENRIKIIKLLRAEKKSPADVLARINERIPIGVSLDSITMYGNSLQIVGRTNNEGLIVSFAKDLEFSGGIFNVFYLKTETSADPKAVEKFKFKIVFNYYPPIDASSPSTAKNPSAHTSQFPQTANNAALPNNSKALE